MNLLSISYAVHECTSSPQFLQKYQLLFDVINMYCNIRIVIELITVINKPVHHYLHLPLYLHLVIWHLYPKWYTSEVQSKLNSKVREKGGFQSLKLLSSLGGINIVSPKTSYTYVTYNHSCIVLLVCQWLITGGSHCIASRQNDCPKHEYRGHPLVLFYTVAHCHLKLEQRRWNVRCVYS